MQVYVAYTEGVNFKKALADLLGLEADASIGACLQRIRHLLDRQGPPLSWSCLCLLGKASLLLMSYVRQ